MSINDKFQTIFKIENSIFSFTLWPHELRYSRCSVCCCCSHPEWPPANDGHVKSPTQDSSTLAATIGFHCPFHRRLHDHRPLTDNRADAFLTLPPSNYIKHHTFRNSKYFNSSNSLNIINSLLIRTISIVPLNRFPLVVNSNAI